MIIMDFAVGIVRILLQLCQLLRRRRIGIARFICCSQRVKGTIIFRESGVSSVIFRISMRFSSPYPISPLLCFSDAFSHPFCFNIGLRRYCTINGITIKHQVMGSATMIPQ